MHEKVKDAIGITCANCLTCRHLGSESNGGEPEYAWHTNYWHVCHKYPRYEFLKPFPFKTEQKCWEPEFWHSKFSDEIRGEDDISAAIDKFKDALAACS